MMQKTMARPWLDRYLVVPGAALVLVLVFCAAGAFADTTDSPAPTAQPERVDAQPADASRADVGKKRRASRKELDARLDELLKETLAADGYRETRSCLSRNAYRKVEVLNEEYVLFSKGEEHWINKLRHRCPSLRFNDLPIFVQRGTSSLCESDPFYPSNSIDLNMSLTGGRAMGAQGICYLGDFEQISAEQAALIRGS